MCVALAICAATTSHTHLYQTPSNFEEPILSNNRGQNHARFLCYAHLLQQLDPALVFPPPPISWNLSESAASLTGDGWPMRQGFATAAAVKSVCFFSARQWL